MARGIATFWRRVPTLLVVTLVLLSGVGVAAAAVSGNFSSSYDGYDDGASTDVRGHEIQVSGTLQFSGENAIRPHIVIRSSKHTVLVDSSVNLLQPGGTSISFERDEYGGGVRYRAEEIPSGTKLTLEFVVYPISGMTQSEITSAQVTVTYELPGGNTEQKQMAITTSLSNTPPQELNEQARSQNVGLLIKGVAVVGSLAILAWIGYIGLAWYRSRQQPY